MLSLWEMGIAGMITVTPWNRVASLKAIQRSARVQKVLQAQFDGTLEARLPTRSASGRLAAVGESMQTALLVPEFSLLAMLFRRDSQSL
jgi:hypothetical protein